MQIELLDQTIDEDQIEGLRDMLIPLRDAALTEGRFDYAVGLSQVLAILAHVKDMQA